MGCNLQLPGEVEGVTGKGVWRHEFSENLFVGIEAVMKLLISHYLVVVSTLFDSASSFTRLHLTHLLDNPTNLTHATQLD